MKSAKINKTVKSSGRLSTSAYLLKALLQYSSQRGVDADAVVKALEYDVNLLRNDQTRVPMAVVNQFWKKISELLDDPCLGLHFGENLGIRGDGHFLFAIMKNCGSLCTALQSLIRYHNLMTDIITPALSVSGGKAFLELESKSGNASISAHIFDASLSLLATVLRKITDNKIVFEKICLSRRSAEAFDDYKKIFGIKPALHSDKDCIVFDESELGRTLSFAHHEFGSHLKKYAEKLEKDYYGTKSINDRVLTMLEHHILSGEDTSLKAIAIGLNMSVRLLQNRLKEEGTTYRGLFDKARKDIALNYLKNDDVLLCDIAFLLGFSEQSSFTHAFKKWTGVSPRDFTRTYRPDSE